MKILRIVSSGYEQGGAENGIILSNVILRMHGHIVKIVSGNDRPDLDHYSDYEFAGVPSSGIRKVINAAFNFDAYRVTKKVLADFEPNVVLLHTMSQPTAAVLFLLKKYPTVLFVHGPEIFTKSLLPWYLLKSDYKHGSYEINDLTFIGYLKYCYFRYVCGFFYKLGLRNVNKIVALSSYTKNFLQKEGFSVTYLPNGAKLLKVTPIKFEKKILLYAGRLEKYKGIDTLIFAMPEIIQVIPDTYLHIAGEGTYSKELKALVKKLKLENSVKFLGHLNQKEMAKAYKDCSIFTLPSIWPETFGKVGIEAMSVGRPVIASRVGCISEWLIDGKTGYLVSPGNSSEIADKVIKLFSNKKLLTLMAKNAGQQAKNFSIEKHTNQIEKLCLGLTKNYIKKLN